ncbi:MAG: hypothetical protein AAF490_28630 [Chloroflexota bacterium]
MNNFIYEVAETLDDAWVNFELDLPLPSDENGDPNPFYVNRPGNPISRLERALLRRFNTPPKWFFSGHRGCGKSTELYRLAASSKIQEKYWPIHFSIRDFADVNNLDYRDVLLAMGGQLFTQYQAQSGNKLKKGLLDELNEWRGRVETKITIVKKGNKEIEVNAGLKNFFAELGGKVKLEPKTREVLHQILEQDINELIELINLIVRNILGNEQKYPLILIDDLDKPDLAVAQKIFYERREVMLQPSCPIVYTVSSPLFYSPEFEAIKDRAIFLPNVKLHEKGNLDARFPEGYYTLRQFIHKRMESNLIEESALELAATMSGGVFRELARVMRNSIDLALADERDVINEADVENAATAMRSLYWRVLTAEQRDILVDVHRHNEMREPDRYAPLLQMLAILEYSNGDPWCDIHPVLREMVEQDSSSS